MDERGDRDAPRGSRAWCRYFANEARRIRADVNGKVENLRRVIGYLDGAEAWRPLGYPSLGMLLQCECDLSPEDIDAIRAADGHEAVHTVLNPNGVKSHDITSSNTRGDTNHRTIGKRCDTEYWMARLARDHPAIAARLTAGEFRSVRAAAIKAGILRRTIAVSRDDPRAAGRLLRRHFKGERLAALIDALGGDPGPIGIDLNHD